MAKRKLFTTRARLATLLLKLGYSGEKVPNPYNPDYGAWEFEWSRELQDIVNEYYDQNGTGKKNG